MEVKAESRGVYGTRQSEQEQLSGLSNEFKDEDGLWALEERTADSKTGFAAVCTRKVPITFGTEMQPTDAEEHGFC